VQVFYEEELDVPLVLFDEVLDHVLRIDRIFRQPQGHLLLIGVSGSGKTTLSRFVAWMNGLSVFQVKVHNKYTADDFDEDLRGVLRRSGCRVSVTVWHYIQRLRIYGLYGAIQMLLILLLILLLLLQIVIIIYLSRVSSNILMPFLGFSYGFVCFCISSSSFFLDLHR